MLFIPSNKDLVSVLFNAKYGQVILHPSFLVQCVFENLATLYPFHLKKMSKESISQLLSVKITPCSNTLIQELRSQIIFKLKEYVEALSKDYADGLLLPTAKTKSTSPLPTTVSVSATDKQLPVTSKSTSQGDGLKIITKKAKITDSFKCEANDLYNVFVTEELVKVFTRSDAKVNGQKGGQFTLMNGQITGEYVQLERPTKIVKKWRSKEWPPGHFSTVTIELLQKDDCTDLTLVQTGIPSSDHERTKEGWKRHIFEPIKSTFGYGSRMY